MNEYYYGETLRWGFGFENPNKAAVIFACLLPLFLRAWTIAWEIADPPRRIIAVALSGCGFLAAGICLVMTFSRGSFVAAIVAMAYLGWVDLVNRRQCSDSKRIWIRSPQFGISILLFAILGGFALWSGLAERSSVGMVNDSSVGNRMSLWQSGLQMAFENPSGFGAGKSGSEFMQWYQDLDRNEGYRTLVNSYLTFLVERGWAHLGGCLFLVILFLRASAKSNDFWIPALKASVLAFLIAGIFSTTMEEGLLWILPGLCVFCIFFLLLRKIPVWKPFSSLALTVGILGGLWLLGWFFSARDLVIRQFSPNSNTVTSISVRSPKKVIALLVDPAVLGENHGKLARSLAAETCSTVTFESSTKAHLVLATGEKCFEPAISPTVIWVAPTIPSGEFEVSPASRPDAATTILVPEIDEDGRSLWWQDRNKTIIIEGVGIRVDWAWEQILETVKLRLDSPE